MLTFNETDYVNEGFIVGTNKAFITDSAGIQKKVMFNKDAGLAKEQLDKDLLDKKD